MKRLHYYDNLRLVLIFLVLFGHFCEISAGNTTYGSFLRFFIYLFHMPLLVFVTGLFHNNDSGEKTVRRSIGFLLIYFLMKIVSLLDYMILYGSATTTLFDEGGIPWFMLALSAWTLMAYATRAINGKALLTISVLVALASGYDYSLTTQFSISRIIVFWPFYLAGELSNKEAILSFVKKKTVRACGTGLLLATIVILWVAYTRISFINPLLTGKNSYESLPYQLVSYGGLIRLCIYMLAIVISAMTMAIVPDKELFCTRFGRRTMSIYFFCQIVYHVTACHYSSLHIWQYFALSIVLIPILGNKWLNRTLTDIAR